MNTASPPDIPFRGLVEQSLAGIYVIQDEIFQYVNATFAAMIGYTAEEMTGMHLRDSVVPDALEELMRNYHLRISGIQPSIRFRTRGRHKSGHVVHLDVHGSRLIYRGRPAVVGVGINISEQVAQELALQDSRERLRELAAYINSVREEQRAGIARNLHDVLGGMLTSIKLGVQRLERRIEDEDSRAIAADLRQLTQETIQTVRQMSEDLRPGVLDHLGLVAALSASLRQFSERTGASCRLIPEKLELDLPQSRATAIYRICQEALTNIARHAEARHVEIRLLPESGHLRLEVEDDGCGIGIGSMNGSMNATGKRIGLTSMSERARELGGTLEIGNRAEGGTRLCLTVPLEPQA